MSLCIQSFKNLPPRFVVAYGAIFGGSASNGMRMHQESEKEGEKSSPPLEDAVLTCRAYAVDPSLIWVALLTGASTFEILPYVFLRIFT